MRIGIPLPLVSIDPLGISRISWHIPTPPTTETVDRISIPPSYLEYKFTLKNFVIGVRS